MTTPLNTVTAATTEGCSATVRKKRLTPAEVDGAAAFFDQLPGDRPDTLANGLFGLYTDPTATPEIADNVQTLWPELWIHRRGHALELGVSTRASAQTPTLGRPPAARELIDLVDGSAYLLEEDTLSEIDAALDILMAAHNGWNNSSSRSHRRGGSTGIVGDHGDVPDAVVRKYVRTIVECFLAKNGPTGSPGTPTRSTGVSSSGWTAGRRAGRCAPSPMKRSPACCAGHPAAPVWTELLEILEPKLTRRSDRDLMDQIRAFSGTPDSSGSTAG